MRSGIGAQDAGVAYRAPSSSIRKLIQARHGQPASNQGRTGRGDRVLDALQTDELCPCNWQQAKRLKPAA